MNTNDPNVGGGISSVPAEKQTPKNMEAYMLMNNIFQKENTTQAISLSDPDIDEESDILKNILFSPPSSSVVKTNRSLFFRRETT